MSLNKIEEKKLHKIRDGFISVLKQEFPEEDLIFIEETHEYFFCNENKIFSKFTTDEINNLKNIKYLKQDDNGKWLLKLNALSNVLHTLEPKFDNNLIVPRVLFKNILNNLVQTNKINNIFNITNKLSSIIKEIHKKDNDKLKYKNMLDTEKSLYDKEGVFSNYKLFKDIFGISIEDRGCIKSLTVEESKLKINNYLLNNFNSDDLKRFFDVYNSLDQLEVFSENYLDRLGSKAQLETRESLLSSWAKTNLIATEKGTIMHLILEDEFNENRKDKNNDLKFYLKLIKNEDIVNKLKKHPNYTYQNEEILKKDALEVSKEAIKLIKESSYNIKSMVEKLKNNGWYPITTEFRLIDVSKCLAGTFDILLYNVKSNEVCIGDWKTNKVLHEKNTFQKLKISGLNIDATNLNLYKLQLSTYFSMLLQSEGVMNFINKNKLQIGKSHIILHVTQNGNQGYSSNYNSSISMIDGKISNQSSLSSNEAGSIVLNQAKLTLEEMISNYQKSTIIHPKYENIEIIDNEEIFKEKIIETKLSKKIEFEHSI